MKNQNSTSAEGATDRDLRDCRDYHELQAQLEYLEDCGMERSATADAVRAKLRLLRGSYTLEGAR